MHPTGVNSQAHTNTLNGKSILIFVLFFLIDSYLLLRVQIFTDNLMMGCYENMSGPKLTDFLVDLA